MQQIVNYHRKSLEMAAIWLEHFAFLGNGTVQWCNKLIVTAWIKPLLFCGRLIQCQTWQTSSAASLCRSPHFKKGSSKGDHKFIPQMYSLSVFCNECIWKKTRVVVRKRKSHLNQLSSVAILALQQIKVKLKINWTLLSSWLHSLGKWLLRLITIDVVKEMHAYCSLQEMSYLSKWIKSVWQFSIYLCLLLSVGAI